MSLPKSYGISLGWPKGAGQPIVDGFNTPGLPSFSAGIRDTIANLTDSDALFFGDSTTANAGGGPTSTPGGLNGNAAAYSPAQVVADLFSPTVASSGHTLVGTSRVSTSSGYNAYDNAATFTGTVTCVTNNAVNGGGVFRLAAAGTMSFNIVDLCDSLELMVDNATLGVVNVKVDGATVATVTSTTALTQTIPLLTFTNLITLEWVSGDFGVLRIHGRNTAIKRFYTNRIGQAGRMLSSYISSASAFGAKSLISTMAPKLVVFDSYINEATASQSQATYKAAFQEGITAAKNAGSGVLLVGGNYAAGTVTPRADYMTSLQELSVLNSVPFLDLALYSEEWSSLANAVAAGYMNTDQIHLSTAGAASKGAAIFDWLTR